MKIHVETDARPPTYRSAVVYATADRPFEGAAIIIRLKDGVAVTGCWPRWPEVMSGRSALWRATPYPRAFGDRTLYSFGIRLDLMGEAPITARVAEWRVEGGIVTLEASRRRGLRAAVGPLLPGFVVLDSRGAAKLIGGSSAYYVLVEGTDVRVRLKAPPQETASGFLEYEPEALEMPFEVRARGLDLLVVERVMVVRLWDLQLL